MAFPSPSDKQAKVLWFSLTALAVAVFLALIGLVLYGVGWLLDRLSPVMLPLAVAGIIAYLLNPLVNFFEGRFRERSVSFLFQNLANPHRLKAIIYVFVLAILLTMMSLTFVVPKAVNEFEALYDNRAVIRAKLDAAANRAEQFLLNFQKTISSSVNPETPRRNGEDLKGKNPDPQPKTPEPDERPPASQEEADAPVPAETSSLINTLSGRLTGLLLTWAEDAAGKIMGWFGILVGMALVPVYVFYFLLEAKRIEGHWTDYLPLMESRFKEEVVYVLSEFNNCLIVFFRCQVLVAICVGFCLAVGFWVIGLPHGILLGMLAGLVGIIPYFGVIISTIPVLALSIAYADRLIWVEGDAVWGAMLSLGVCVVVLLLEKTVIQPKIVGDRVGMHPVAVIIAVLMGTALVGGIIGGLLAIPIVMAGRTLLFRYIWTGRVTDDGGEAQDPEPGEAEAEPA